MASSGDYTRVRVERGIYRQTNGKYAVCVMVAGRPRFRTLEAVTLAEARKQRELLCTLGAFDGLPVSPRVTFAEIAARWLGEFEAKVAVGARRDRTLDLNRSQLRLHLLPRLGRRRIASITSDDVVALTGQLQAQGLSPWSVKRILAALSYVFSYAIRRGYITRHPFDCLERDERPHPLRSDQRVLTRSELVRLLAACPHPYRPLLATGAYTGMRLSEVLALSWDDIDFAAGVIHVRHQLARGRPRNPAAPHRTQDARLHPRDPAPPPARRRPARAQATRTLHRQFGLRVRDQQRHPFLHHNVSKRVLRRAAVDSGLDRAGRRVRFHDLRHTFASHLIIDIRLDVVQVSRILGHARTSMTLDTYTHLFEEARHGNDLRAELAKSAFATCSITTSSRDSSPASTTARPVPRSCDLVGTRLRSAAAAPRGHPPSAAAT